MSLRATALALWWRSNLQYNHKIALGEEHPRRLRLVAMTDYFYYSYTKASRIVNLAAV